MDSLADYEELSTFANVRYTPAWYYRQFPGFYNIECYKILAQHTQVIPLEPVLETDTESESQTQKNKKRVYDEVEHTSDP